MSIALEQIAKHFGRQVIVDRVSLKVLEGELFVLLGASGSGKSTILRITAGLLAPDHGRVLLHGRDVTGLPPQKRDVAFVFQNYTVFRHMTVAENIESGKTKPTSRVWGGSPETSRPWSRTRPWSGARRPAVIRRIVLLPLPLAPKSTNSSPSRTSSDTRSTMTCRPKCLAICSRAMDIPSRQKATWKHTRPTC